MALQDSVMGSLESTSPSLMAHTTPWLRDRVYTDVLMGCVQAYPELNNFFALHFILLLWDKEFSTRHHAILLHVLQHSGKPIQEYEHWWEAFSGPMLYSWNELERLFRAGLKKLLGVCPFLVPLDYLVDAEKRQVVHVDLANLPWGLGRNLDWERRMAVVSEVCAEAVEARSCV